METDGPLINVGVTLQGPCNYQCYYCYLDREQLRNAPFGPLCTDEGTDRLIALLDRLGTCLVNVIGGGEATIIPNFLSFCERITQRHYLLLITNFSVSFDEFLDRIPPERLDVLLISMHPQHEQRLEAFVNNVRQLKSKGYGVQLTYVAHPRRLKRIEPLFRRFADLGIPFKAAPFKGSYKGRELPQGYTEAELDLILPYLLVPSAYHVLERGPRLHAGKLCSAGCNAFEIEEGTGSITRCPDSRHVIGNLYEEWLDPLPGPRPCEVGACQCGSHLEEDVWLAKQYRECYSEGGIRPLTRAQMAEYYELCEPNWQLYTRCVPDLLREGVPVPDWLRGQAWRVMGTTMA